MKAEGRHVTVQSKHKDWCELFPSAYDVLTGLPEKGGSVGVDLVSTDRIEKLLTQFKKKFADKIFTTNETLRANQIDNLSMRALFYAKRFAAKEAFSKALGLGIGRGVDFKDIEIENDELGKPQI